MSVSVCTALADDAAEVAHIASETFAMACPPGTEPEDMAAFIASTLSRSRFESYIADPARTVLLARSADDHAVGYAMVVHGDPVDAAIARSLTLKPTIELSKLYVLADGHGSGVAGSLMSAAVERGRSLGCSGMWLGVNQQNLRAQKFYGKHGFTAVGVKTFVVGKETHDDFVMERAL